MNDTKKTIFKHEYHFPDRNMVTLVSTERLPFAVIRYDDSWWVESYHLDRGSARSRSAELTSSCVYHKVVDIEKDIAYSAKEFKENKL